MAGGCCRSVPILKLHVQKSSEMVGQVVLSSNSGREDIYRALQDQELSTRRWVATVLIVNLAATQQEIAVQPQTGAHVTFHSDSTECAPLGINVAAIDRIGSPPFQEGTKAVEGARTDIDARSEAKVLASA